MALMALTGLVPRPLGLQADVLIGQAARRFTIVSEETPTPPPAKPELDIKLIQVIPRSGNNPLHTTEPINNRDGQVISPTTPSGNYPQVAQYVAGAPGFGFAQLVVNPANDSAQISSGSGPGANGLIFQLGQLHARVAPGTDVGA